MNILRMTVRITKLFVHTIKQITYKGLGMENENISPNLVFQKFSSQINGKLILDAQNYSLHQLRKMGTH